MKRRKASRQRRRSNAFFLKNAWLNRSCSHPRTQPPVCASHRGPYKLLTQHDAIHEHLNGDEPVVGRRVIARRRFDSRTCRLDLRLIQTNIRIVLQTCAQPLATTVPDEQPKLRFTSMSSMLASLWTAQRKSAIRRGRSCETAASSALTSEANSLGCRSVN